jgi:hypothetical protein
MHGGCARCKEPGIVAASGKQQKESSRTLPTLWGRQFPGRFSFVAASMKTQYVLSLCFGISD